MAIWTAREGDDRFVVANFGLQRLQIGFRHVWED
jgi:hypothetical protein